MRQWSRMTEIPEQVTGAWRGSRGGCGSGGWGYHEVFAQQMGFEPLLTVTNPPPAPTYTHTSSTYNHWQGCSPNLRRPRDQVMLRKRISSNWILLAQAQEFSLQWSWVWCARNASSIGRRGIRRGKAKGSGGLEGVMVVGVLMFRVSSQSNTPSHLTPLLMSGFKTCAPPAAIMYVHWLIWQTLTSNVK